MHTTSVRTAAQEIDSIVGYVYEALDKAWEAVERIETGDALQLSDGVKDAIVWGRTSTFILQRLSSRVSGWADWWDEQVIQMRSDSLLRYFNSLRSAILKTGETHIGFKLTYQPAARIIEEIEVTSPRPHAEAQLVVNSATGFC